MIETPTGAPGAPAVSDQTIGTSHTTSYRRIVLALVAAAVLLMLGIWMRWANVGYDGPPNAFAFTRFQFERLTYSDIATLFFRDNLQRHPIPYFQYDLEYPVLTGLLVYVMNFARTMPAYFIATSVVLAVCGLISTALLGKIRGSNIFIFALSPALALYVNLNWDLWGILFLVAALLLFQRKRYVESSALLAISVWAKFFPVAIVPLLLLERVRRGRWEEAGVMASVFSVVSVIVNAPILLTKPGALLHFFTFNQQRPREFNVWSFVDGLGLTTNDINRLSLLLLGIGIAFMLALLWRRPDAVFVLACAAVCWFMFLNKVYSPQYSLWVIAFLAIAGISPALSVAWWGADALYFTATFMLWGLQPYGDAVPWMMAHIFLPATAIREGVLLVIVGYCFWLAWQARRPGMSL